MPSGYIGYRYESTADEKSRDLVLAAAARGIFAPQETRLLKAIE